MLDKVQRKILAFKHAVDVCSYENDILTIKGWAFSTKYEMVDIYLCVKTKEDKYKVKLSKDFNRSDVYNEFPVEEAKKVVFMVESKLKILMLLKQVLSAK